MSYETLIYRKEDAMGTITLNRPKQKNALNDVMMSELSELIRDIALDDEVRVVIITGGKDFFAAGVDIKLVSTIPSAVKAYDFSRNSPMAGLEKLEKPVFKGQ